MSENKVVNKYCLVPDCPNTSKNAPEKWFINVPSNIKIRNVWQKAMRREVFVSNKSHVYCCEDHFKVEEDIENYMYIKTMNSGKVRLKPGVVPRFFDCQKNRITTHSSKPRSQFLQTKAQQSVIETLLLSSKNRTCEENQEEEENEMDIRRMEPISKEIGVQAHIKAYDSQEYSIMASEHYKCKAEPWITDIEEAEAKQNACGTYFVDINDILKRGIKEEAIEFNPFSEYGVSNECLEKHWNEKLNDPNSSEFNVMPRNTVEDTKESKFSPTHFWGNTNSNGLAKPKVDHFENGVIIKIEDHSECTEDLSTNSADWKTETLKTEIGTEFIYEDVKHQICEEDVKHQICEEKSNGKNEYESCRNSVGNILIGTENEPRIRRKLSKGNKDTPAAQRMRLYRQRLREGTVNESNTGNYSSMIRRRALTGAERAKLFRQRKKLSKENSSYTTIQSSLFENNKFIVLNNTSSSMIMNSETRPQQHIEVDETAAERDNDTRQEPKISIKPKICSKSFALKGDVRQHESIHKGEKQFLCKICAKPFKHKTSLTIHERIHTGEKPFQCQICSKSFFLNKNLTQHERIHTGVKPFQCKICSKSFIQKGHLTNHEIIHMKGKPFQCNICLKSFNQKSYLVKHERIHTEKKPFQCKICLKLFILKERLTKHERIHTG